MRQNGSPEGSLYLSNVIIICFYLADIASKLALPGTSGNSALGGNLVCLEIELFMELNVLT